MKFVECEINPFSLYFHSDHWQEFHEKSTVAVDICPKYVCKNNHKLLNLNNKYGLWLQMCLTHAHVLCVHVCIWHRYTSSGFMSETTLHTYHTKSRLQLGWITPSPLIYGVRVELIRRNVKQETVRVSEPTLNTDPHCYHDNCSRRTTLLQRRRKQKDGLWSWHGFPEQPAAIWIASY